MPKVLGKGRGLKDMSNSLSRVDQVVIDLQRFERLGLDVKKLPKVIVQELIGDVRQALLNALSRSGLKSRSGNLKRAVATASVNFANGKLRYSFPSGMRDDVNRYGASLNYGSVRQPRGTGNADKLGGRARRTLKHAALTGKKLSARQQSRFTKGVKQVHDGKALIKNAVNIGSAKVIPPKPFFRISRSDEIKIRKKFERIFEFLIRKVIQKK